VPDHESQWVASNKRRLSSCGLTARWATYSPASNPSPIVCSLTQTHLLLCRDLLPGINPVGHQEATVSGGERILISETHADIYRHESATYSIVILLGDRNPNGLFQV